MSYLCLMIVYTKDGINFQKLKTNKPIDEKQGEDIESIFEKAKSNQEVEQVPKIYSCDAWN